MGTSCTSRICHGGAPFRFVTGLVVILGGSAWLNMDGGLDYFVSSGIFLKQSSLKSIPSKPNLGEDVVAVTKSPPVTSPPLVSIESPALPSARLTKDVRVGRKKVQRFSCPTRRLNVEPDWMYNLGEGAKQGQAGCCLSQDIQDVYLAGIFEAIGVTNKFFVEFGFNAPSLEDGSGPNTYALRKCGWKGLLLDGGNQNLSINLHRHMLFQSNIAGLFQQYSVPLELDYLSVDMDSHDLFVLRAILKGGFKPRVISTEFNSNYWGSNATISMLDPTLGTGTVPPNFEYHFMGCTWGASAAAFTRLAVEFGYTLVGRVYKLDIFFVRNDLLLPTWKTPSWDFVFPQRRIGITYGHTNTAHMLNGKIFERLIDYDTYARTLDIPTSVAKAKEIVCQRFKEHKCFKLAILKGCTSSSQSQK